MNQAITLSLRNFNYNGINRLKYMDEKLHTMQKLRQTRVAILIVKNTGFREVERWFCG